MPAEPPPPGGGYTPQGLRGVALRSRRAASGTCYLPWGDIPYLLADNAMRLGREDGWLRLSRLGLQEFAFRPPGLRRLVIGYEGGQTSQHPLFLQKFVYPSNPSISSLQGGPRLVAISLNLGSGGGLCGA